VREGDGRQALADVQWACERAGEHSSAARLHLAMRVPWRVLPGAFPQLSVEQVFPPSANAMTAQTEREWRDVFAGRRERVASACATRV
jgi:hypothetical protein